MEQLQRRRHDFRLAIRRSDIDSRMNIKRALLSTDFHTQRCRNFINDLCSSNQSSLFVALANYISNCHPAEKRVWAVTAWEMLTSLAFTRWQAGFEGLACLLLAIYHQLSEKQRRMLPCRPVMEALLGELEESVVRESSFHDQLFQVTFQLSIYASEQSHFHINFSEEMVETVIDRAHAHTNTASLQVLAAVLANLEEGSLRKCLKQKIKYIGKTIFTRLDAAENRLLHLQTLATIGLFEESDIDVARAILEGHSELGFPLVLRFLAYQSSQAWITYEMAEQFLLGCSRQMQGKCEISLFLTCISNICRSEYYQDDLMCQIYTTFFAERLHHFVSYDTMVPVTEMLVQYFLLGRAEMENELMECALKIVKLGEFKLNSLDPGHLMILCNYLFLNHRINDPELIECIGRDKYLEFWERYEINNQTDQNDCC